MNLSAFFNPPPPLNIFIQYWRFKSPQIYELVSLFYPPSPGLVEHDNTYVTAAAKIEKYSEIKLTA